MTAKRNSQRKPKNERPKVNKETLRDLESRNNASVRGGAAAGPSNSDGPDCYR